eukprot:TRINITY_DN67836_c4_g2_i1.p1 TRINITY_DN67836_c4_g2~~TRINITY_DN67836_c4_g2_i1.p1  ORF type:complete len:138 (-),score=1.76 TRINITY_DN67836_c4_g2_i1:166-579(-)
MTMLTSLRTLSVGVFVGYVLMDLAFDFETLRGNPARVFYLERGQHGVLSRLILVLPLLGCIIVHLLPIFITSTTTDVVALALCIAVNGLGAMVMKLRAEMDKNPKETKLVQNNLNKIAKLHIAMLVLMLPLMVVVCV